MGLGRSFNASLWFAGTAVPAGVGHQVALLPAGSPCALAASAALRAAVSEVGTPVVMMDLADLSPRGVPPVPWAYVLGLCPNVFPSRHTPPAGGRVRASGSFSVRKSPRIIFFTFSIQRPGGLWK